ncbi:hypothetical protein EPUS_06294 [Endocarpon pusillum Z07020]|uniref:Integrase zinc-binding domain-containing protein n=1 Tax=Endocarpon pusillum (strain Z07020 / HMAS-L-300199) TaxID=1263415 RepID=U1GY62_ENDPU|nr:uncharacterized protein EPUS_06294 [Endocarpon pusillum Z07020]ERF77076.1 hypothetical protein EPUS_06294 [Endocarpon pusillum Z07020]
MTSYTPPRSSQDLNHFMASPSLAIPHYTNNDNNYNYSPHPQYENVSPTHSTYAASFISSQHQDTHYLSENLQMAAQYPYSTPLLNNGAYHHRPLAQTTPYSLQQLSQHPLAQSPRYSNHHDPYQHSDVESQESANERTMLSEPVLPPLDGFPDIKEFDRLINFYVESLSSKKQDKALIHARRARNIKAVLIDKKTTAVESAQFRFWVKKMFTLMPDDSKIPESKRKICHEGKPVAIREKLFKILTRAHKQCQHGGRDKTSAQVRRVYSWVPKELISRFVKICPTCKARRGCNSHVSPPISPKHSSSVYSSPQSPALLSPPASRRDSLLSRHSSMLPSSPVGTHVYGSQYQGNQWLSSAQNVHSPEPVHSGSSSTMVSGSSMSSIGQNGLSLNYTSSGLSNGNVGSHRSYSNGYDASDNYSQPHQY